jgi:hypothetical protein
MMHAPMYAPQHSWKQSTCDCPDQPSTLTKAASSRRPSIYHLQQR